MNRARKWIHETFSAARLKAYLFDARFGVWDFWLALMIVAALIGPRPWWFSVGIIAIWTAGHLWAARKPKVRLRAWLSPAVPQSRYALERDALAAFEIVDGKPGKAVIERSGIATHIVVETVDRRLVAYPLDPVLRRSYGDTCDLRFPEGIEL